MLYLVDIIQFDMKNIIPLIYYLSLFLSPNLSGQETILFPGDIAQGYRFGYSVTAFDDYIVVNARGGNPDVSLGGAAYVFRKNGTDWVEEAKLIPSDPVLQGYFAYSLSAYNNYILIGAPSDDENGTQSGAAYIFKKEGDIWVEQTKLLPSDGYMNDNAGGSVSLFGDYAIIGSPVDEINNQISSGSAYIFKRVGDNWVEETKLVPSDPTYGATFGLTVSLYNNYVVIGSPKSEHNNIKPGAAYIFRKIGDDWVEEAKLVPSDASDLDDFGSSVTASENTVLVSASKGGEGVYERGSAYLFRKIGDDWEEEVELTPYDETADDMFSISSSFSGDLVAVGIINSTIAGSVHLFQKQGVEWTEKLKIIPSNYMEYDRFGRNVFLTENYAVMGASHSEVGGRVYVYDLNILLDAEEVIPVDYALKILSNPAKEVIHLQLSIFNQPFNIRIFDVNGREMYHEKLRTSTKLETIEVQVANWTRGIYFVHIDLPDNQLVRKVLLD